MVKIYLDPGHGGRDPGAQGNGLQEKQLTLAIARKIEEILKREYDGVSIKMSRTTDRTVSLAERTSDANNWGADLYLSIHINAGGGTGFESYIFPNSGSLTARYRRNIHNEVIAKSRFRNRGMKTANFHVLRETTMPAVLTENGFIDSQEAPKLNSEQFREQIARGHAEGIAKAYQLDRKQNNSVRFRVQIGSFRNKENADRTASEARTKGFNTYVFRENSLWKVQIGAFTHRNNAELLAARAMNAGFNATLEKK